MAEYRHSGATRHPVKACGYDATRKEAPLVAAQEEHFAGEPVGLSTWNSEAAQICVRNHYKALPCSLRGKIAAEAAATLLILKTEATARSL